MYDHSKATEPYGPDSERLVTLQSGMSLVERIHTSNKPTFISYTIPSFGAVGDLLLRAIAHANVVNRARKSFTDKQL